MDFRIDAGLTRQEPVSGQLDPEDLMKRAQITKRPDRREHPAIEPRAPSGRVLPF